jgi:hypothetical protein
MALEAGITQDALTIAEAIHGYARTRGWTGDSYHIFMSANVDWSTIRVQVVARGFDDRSEEQEYRDYDDVMDLIEMEAKLRLRVTNYYSLVLTGMSDFVFYPTRRLGQAEFEIDEKLINNGISWSEPFRPSPR